MGTYPPKLCLDVFTNFLNLWDFQVFHNLLPHPVFHLPPCSDQDREPEYPQQFFQVGEKAKEGLNSNTQYRQRWKHAIIFKIQIEISISLKMCPNLMAYFRGVVAHLPRIKIQNIKPTEGSYHHLKGFWDWSIYNWSKTLLVLSTWVE